jgi:hypothetical protein
MKITSALLTASALLLISAPALADAPSDTATKAINADYAANCAAVLDPTDKNMEAMFGVMSSDFVNLDLKGKKQTKDEVSGQIKLQLKQFHGTSCDNTVATMSAPDANTVVAVVTQKIAGDFQAPDGKHEVDATTKTEDTWKLVSGAWQLTQSKDLRILLKIDGTVQDDEGQ